MRKNLYTAVGILKTSGQIKHGEYPTVTINKKEYILDINELILWSVLNWRILSEIEAEKLFAEKQAQFGLEDRTVFNDCLKRLVQRGLLAEGIGETEADALYDLLSELYIVPISHNFLLRTLSFIRLTFLNKVPYSVTKKIFGKDKRTKDEEKVMKLANQSLLSTAEMIKCVEDKCLDFRTEEQLIELLYTDEFTTCDNISVICKNMESCRSVLISVANLLLRRQIVLERI